MALKANSDARGRLSIQHCCNPDSMRLENKVKKRRVLLKGECYFLEVYDFIYLQKFYQSIQFHLYNAYSGACFLCNELKFK